MVSFGVLLAVRERDLESIEMVFRCENHPENALQGLTARDNVFSVRCPSCDAEYRCSLNDEFVLDGPPELRAFIVTPHYPDGRPPSSPYQRLKELTRVVDTREGT